MTPVFHLAPAGQGFRLGPFCVILLLMSQRSSFTTDYIYCPKCLAAAQRHLLARRKFLCSVEIPGWSKDCDPLPVISGKTGGLYPGEEIDDFKMMAGDLCREVCHTLLIALLPEGAAPTVFYIYPGSCEVRSLPVAECRSVAPAPAEPASAP